MKNTKRTRPGTYLYVPREFVRALDYERVINGDVSRQQVLERLSKKLLEKNKGNLKVREYIEFPW